MCDSVCQPVPACDPRTPVRQCVPLQCLCVKSQCMTVTRKYRAHTYTARHRHTHGHCTLSRQVHLHTHRPSEAVVGQESVQFYRSVGNREPKPGPFRYPRRGALTTWHNEAVWAGETHSSHSHMDGRDRTHTNGHFTHTRGGASREYTRSHIT